MTFVQGLSEIFRRSYSTWCDSSYYSHTVSVRRTSLCLKWKVVRDVSEPFPWHRWRSCACPPCEPWHHLIGPNEGVWLAGGVANVSPPRMPGEDTHHPHSPTLTCHIASVCDTLMQQGACHNVCLGHMQSRTLGTLQSHSTCPLQSTMGKTALSINSCLIWV